MIIRGEHYVGTPTIESFLHAFESQIPEIEKITATSGLRTAQDQTRIIDNYATSRGIYYPEFVVNDVDGTFLCDEFGKIIHTWQRTWSKLLELKVIINPPSDAECLYPYWKDGVNRQGSIIRATVHKYGKAVDLWAESLDTIVKNLENAKKNGVKFNNYLVERENDAVHVNV